MTPAERQQRRRDRIKVAYPRPPQTDAAWLRDRLIAEIEAWRLVRPDLSTADIADVVQQWIVDRYRLKAWTENQDRVLRKPEAGQNGAPARPFFR
jgi:hypothetical protein